MNKTELLLRFAVEIMSVELHVVWVPCYHSPLRQTEMVSLNSLHHYSGPSTMYSAACLRTRTSPRWREHSQSTATRANWGLPMSILDTSQQFQMVHKLSRNNCVQNLWGMIIWRLYALSKEQLAIVQKPSLGHEALPICQSTTHRCNDRSCRSVVEILLISLRLVKW